MDPLASSRGGEMIGRSFAFFSCVHSVVFSCVHSVVFFCSVYMRCTPTHPKRKTPWKTCSDEWTGANLLHHLVARLSRLSRSLYIERADTGDACDEPARGAATVSGRVRPFGPL